MAPTSAPSDPQRRVQGASSSSVSPGTHSIHSSTNPQPQQTPFSTKTIPLAQRLLQPHNPYVPLPPILLSTSSQHQHSISQLDAELYDIIALSLRAFVSSWWHTYISPRDKSFLPEISLVIVHVLQVLEQRVLAANLDKLIYHTIPILLVQHYRDYRTSVSKLHTSYASLDLNSFPKIFHASQPHLGVDECGTFNDVYLRQAVDHILKACLPPDDYENELERSIVREILVKPVLGAVLPQVAQPWFLYSLALTLIGVPTPLESPPPPPPPPPAETKKTIALRTRDLLITLLTFIQTISTTCLALISFFQSTFALISTINALPPSRPSTGNGEKKIKDEQDDIVQPVIYLTAEALTMRERNASAAVLSIIQASTTFFRPFFEKLLPYILHTQLLTPPQIVQLAQLSKRMLFPGGSRGPPSIIPPPEEQLLMREVLERKLLGFIPHPLRPYLLGPNSTLQHQTIASALDAFSSRECNAHLVILLFDAIVLALFPELGGGAGGADGVRGNAATMGEEGMGSGVTPSSGSEGGGSSSDSSFSAGGGVAGVELNVVLGGVESGAVAPNIKH